MRNEWTNIPRFLICNDVQGDQMNRLKTILCILAIFGLQVSAPAEMRTWTLKNGKTFEGDMTRTYLNKMVLLEPDGNEITVPLDLFNFSDADREYLSLEDPPGFKVEIKKSIQRKNFAMVRGSEGRPLEQRATFGAKVTLVDKRDYAHELTVEYFAIGDEINGDRHILLDRMKSTFLPGSENKWSHEFYSGRTVRMTDLPFLQRDLADFTRRGEQYGGFVVTVRDMRGKLIAIDSSREWMTDHLENLEKLRIGNYFDEKTCLRAYPSRPRSYYEENNAGRP